MFGDDDQLLRLQARIAGLSHLQEPVRAMRAMAGARLQEGQAVLAGSASHVATVERALRQAAALLPPGEGEARGIRATAPMLLAIGSEHGFAGGFNDRVVAAALAVLTAGGREGSPRCCTVGTRLTRLAVEQGVSVAWHLPMATHAPAATVLARALADRLAGSGRVLLLHARHRPGASLAVERRQVLPLPAGLHNADQVPPLHHLPPARLWQALSEEYLFAVLADALLHSFVAENAARLQAMEAADRNIADRLDGLQRRARSLRQEGITEELLDVVTGELALLD